MKAAVIEEFGKIHDVKIEDVPAPEPGPDEVQIHMAYAGINPVDWKVCEGWVKTLLPHDFPIVLGWDGTGTISKVGSNVSNLKVGDEVYAFFRKDVFKWGTFCEYATFPAKHVVLKPRNLSFCEAATVPLAALTAWQALFDFIDLQKGETILIHAGAGGVGSYALQLAKHAGATIYTTTSSRNHDYVKSLGADVAIDYKHESFVDRIRKDVPEGLDAILDCVGFATLEKSYDLVRDHGRLASIVNNPDKKRTEPRHIKSGFVFVRPDGEELKKITSLIEDGSLVAPEIHEYRLDQVQEALQKSADGHTRGKISLAIA